MATIANERAGLDVCQTPNRSKHLVFAVLYTLKSEKGTISFSRPKEPVDYSEFLRKRETSGGAGETAERAYKRQVRKANLRRMARWGWWLRRETHHTVAVICSGAILIVALLPLLIMSYRGFDLAYLTNFRLINHWEYPLLLWTCAAGALLTGAFWLRRDSQFAKDTRSKYPLIEASQATHPVAAAASQAEQRVDGPERGATPSAAAACVSCGHDRRAHFKTGACFHTETPGRDLVKRCSYKEFQTA